MLTAIMRLLVSDPNVALPKRTREIQQVSSLPANGSSFASPANIQDTLSSVVRADENRCDSPIDGLTGHSFFSRNVKGRDARVLVIVSNFTLHQQGATSLPDVHTNTTTMTARPENVGKRRQESEFLHAATLRLPTRRFFLGAEMFSSNVSG